MTGQPDHPFSRAGYAAPYKLVGAVESWHDPLKGAMFNDGSARKPSGTCDVCGTCFGYGATWKDANGSAFKTGLICAQKAHAVYGPSHPDFETAKLLGDMYKDAASRFQTEKRRVNRQAAAAKRKAKRETEDAESRASYLDIDFDALAKIAHPNEYRAEHGETFADYVQWWEQSASVSKALKFAQVGIALYASGNFNPVIEVFEPNTSNSQHVGKFRPDGKGVREIFTIRRFFMINFDTAFGETYIVKFVDQDGNVLSWKTKDPFGVSNDDNKNEWLEVKATPKSHEEDKYNDGRPVTWISRPALA